MDNKFEIDEGIILADIEMIKQLQAIKDEYIILRDKNGIDTNPDDILSILSSSKGKWVEMRVNTVIDIEFLKKIGFKK